MIEDRIKIITRRDLIRGVYDRWIGQYPPSKYGDTDKGNRAVALFLLDREHCTREDIDNLIGNSSWTRNFCNVCGEDSEVIAQLGDEPDYESTTLNICEKCLVSALQAVRATYAQATGKTDEEISGT